MTPNAAMIFAAGFGTRMGELTRVIPKALLPVSGVPLLDRTLDLAEDAGINRLVVNTHYRAGQIEAHLKARDVILSHEVPDILDTGGGLRAALPKLQSDTVFTSNSDAVWAGPNPFTTLARHWKPGAMEALLLLVPLQDAVGRKGGGDFDLVDGQLIRGDDFVYTGVQILKTAPVAAQPKAVFSLNVVWDEIARTGGLCGAVYPGRWCDVGHPEGLTLAENMLDGAQNV